MASARPLLQKSTPEEIRARFDADVDRFTSLDTGQQTVPGARRMLDLLAAMAPRQNLQARRLLDIGCGAGNQAIAVARGIPGIHIDLADLSPRMLAAALERVSRETSGKVCTLEGDFRELGLPQGSYDIVIAGAVLHHLREDADWHASLAKIHRAMRSGGCLWVSDMIAHDEPAIHEALWEDYRRHLESLGGPAYADKVFGYIDIEDSPRSLAFQFDVLREVGFRTADVVHKEGLFALYYAVA